jgi:hypothetical protein
MGPDVRGPMQSAYLGPPAEGKARHRYAVAVILFFLISFVVGAALTPWLYGLIVQVANWIGVTADPFPRYIPRVIPIVALLILRPLAIWAGFKSPADVGLVAPRGQSRKFLFGFSAAMLALAMVCAIELNVGALTLRASITLKAVLDALAVALASALAVALVEEILYRGMVLSLLARVCNWPTALLLSSLIFTLMHFLHRPVHEGPIAWYSGLALLPAMLAGWLDPHNLGAYAANLFLAGTLIGIAYGLTGNLYFSMGLHAGAVVCSKLSLAFTVFTPGAATWFWGSGNLVDSWFTAGALLVAAVMFGVNSVRGGRPAAAGPDPVAAGARFGRSIEAVFVAYLAMLAVALLVSFAVTR